MTSVDQIDWRSDDELTIGDTDFRVAPFGRSTSTPHRFLLLKNRQMVDAYVDLARSLRPRHIVELGIYAGGSTAFLELVMRPAKLVAFELANERIQALDQFLQRKDATERVLPCYGVSQADRDAVLPVLRENFPAMQLDLVIDDASHDLELTRQSFNLLFPLLRHGGVYVIEDWGWGHFEFARERRGPSLAKLVLEVVLSLPFSQDLIADVSVNRYWAVVRRGAAEVPSPFDISEHVSDRGRQLLAASDEDPRLLQV